MKFFTKYPKFTVSFIDYLVLEVLKKHLLILVNKFLYLNIFSLAKKAANQFMKCTPNIGRISICLDGMSSVLYRAHVV